MRKGRIVCLRAQRINAAIEFTRISKCRLRTHSERTIHHIAIGKQRLVANTVGKARADLLLNGFNQSPGLDVLVGIAASGRTPYVLGAMETARNHGVPHVLIGCTAPDKLLVEGVGEARARTVREALSRMAETSMIDRY